MNDNDLKYFDEVVDTYHRYDKSIRETANRLNISRTKVRKILITMGEIESDITSMALPLIEDGKSLGDISKILEISIATLSTYLPYGNKVYGRKDKTNDAIRCEKYKKRKKIAENSQINIVENNNMMINENKRELKVFKLHLELEDSRNQESLIKYGKVKNSISRDILVPFDYPLHSLNYAILKLFGWQNSHLHHFEFSKEVMNEIIDNKFANYVKLCGYLFRPPYDNGDDLDDIYWDDDYEGNVSFKTWLKRKYKFPYKTGSMLENYIFAQRRILMFCKENEELTMAYPFDEYLADKHGLKTVNVYEASFKDMNSYFELQLGEIVERLSVGSLLSLEPNSIDKLRIDGDIKDESYLSIIFENDKNEPVPVTDSIKYLYDYGDGWEVSIKLTEVYELVGDDTARLINHDGVEEIDLEDILSDILRTGDPYCLEADGLPVMDDVGGIYGYCRFLDSINDKNNTEEANELKEWASGQGWSGRMPKAEKML